MQIIELLRKLVSFDTQSHKSNKLMVNFIAELFDGKKLTITPLQKNPETTVYNLEVVIEGEKHDRPLVFSGHTDTVPVSNAWTRDPFGAEITGGKIFGLGASDMKAGVAAMILAATMIEFKPKQDIILLFDADEEAGCLGGKDFINRLEIKPGSAEVIVAEPTNCLLEIGQKGGLEIKVIYSGKASHSSRTSFEQNRENNAVHKAMASFAYLEEIERKLDDKKDELFRPPTQSICQISGGTASNVIPDHCAFVINRRLLPSESMDSAVEEINTALKKIDPNVKTEIVFWGEPNLVDQNSKFFGQCKRISDEILGRTQIRVTDSWTQAGLFKKWGNCLIWGPGNAEMSHQADEYCEISHLNKMIGCYKRLIETHC